MAVTVMSRSSAVQRQACALPLVLLIGISPVVAGNPQLDDSLLSQAEEQARRQNWSEAEALARRYLQASADSGNGHALLGFILFSQRRWKESRAEYVEADKWLTQSLEMNPEDAKGWEALGHIKFAEQRFEEAIKAYQRSLTLTPRVVSAEIDIGLSCELLSRLEDAKAAYKTAIGWEAPKSHDPTPFLGLGRVLLKQNRPAEALPYLRRAVELGPALAQAHEELGKAYSSLNQLAAAQREIERAIELAPKVVRLHFMLGQIYRRAGLMEKAKTELDRYAALVGTSSTPDVDPR
jgi:tetratricopeptide (TPR) repeat protein